jgi:hypothetical protein
MGSDVTASRNVLHASTKLSRRSLATVQDTPVRRYGGLKDQDRIFTNIYSRHDHGIKGAMVHILPLSRLSVLLGTHFNSFHLRLVVIGTVQRISSLKVIAGSSTLSKKVVFEVEEVLVSLRD